MEDLKAILTIGARCTVHYSTAGNVCHSAVHYRLYGVQMEKFLIINLIIYRLWKHYRLCQSWHREGTAI